MRNLLLLFCCLALGACYESDRQQFAGAALTGRIAAGDWLQVGIFDREGSTELTPKQIRDYDCDPLLDGHICLIGDEGTPRYVVNTVRNQANGINLVTEEDVVGDGSSKVSQVGAVDLGNGVLLLEVSEVGEPKWRYALAKLTRGRRGKDLLLVRHLDCDAESCPIRSAGEILSIARAANKPSFFADLTQLIGVYMRR